MTIFTTTVLAAAILGCFIGVASWVALTIDNCPESAEEQNGCLEDYALR